jgi:hypothetical protein
MAAATFRLPDADLRTRGRGVVLTRSVKERTGGGVERKGAVTMGGVLYNDVAEGGKKFGQGSPAN